MSKPRLLLSCRSPATIARDEAGLAAVEFALVMPIMLLLYLGVVEVAAGVRFAQQFDLTAHTVGDLVGQLSSGANGQAALTDNQIAGVFAAANALIAPYASTSLNVTISEVLISNNNSGVPQATLDWTVANGGPSAKIYACPTVTLNATYPTSNPLLPANFPSMTTFTSGTGIQFGPMIVTEISYVYTPKIQLVAGLFGAASGVTFSRVTYSPVRNTFSNANYSYLANHILDAMTSGTANQSNCLPGGN
jgi:Flp pilus assembly protein TadG